MSSGAAAFAAAPIEVGTVEWRRDFEGVLSESGQTGKPVFAFFQEVPGCSGCQKFGSEVMSHPVIVQAVKNEFVPVLIYNNRSGNDAALLKRYGEPAWNYQVIRFLDGAGKDLIPRKDRVWTPHALALRMMEALEVSGRPVPRYLEVAALESDTDRQASVAFAQHCFWQGEAVLGRLPGVITTEAGWLEGREVTLVSYHPETTSLASLVEKATDAGLADKIFVATREERQSLSRERRTSAGSLDESYRAAGESDQKRQIRGTVYDELTLSPMQRTKVNAFARSDPEEARAWLTPEQLRELERRVAESRLDD
jgi:hypothetical protein